jgi:hypothetical protein
MLANTAQSAKKLKDIFSFEHPDNLAFMNGGCNHHG